jgi:hypothetical protein
MPVIQQQSIKTADSPQSRKDHPVKTVMTRALMDDLLCDPLRLCGEKNPMQMCQPCPAFNAS